MRNVATAFILSVALLAAAGCARQHASASVDPAPFELPRMQFVEPVLPAIVEVQGRQSAAPVGLLVEKFEEPPLTPEEEEAMRPEGVQYDFLATYQPERGEKHGVSPSPGGAAIGIHGAGGAKYGLGPSPRTAFASNVYSGRPADIHPQSARGAGRATWQAPESWIGRPVGVYVGYGPDSKLASRRTRLRP